MKLHNFIFTSNDFSYILQNIPQLSGSLGFPGCKINVDENLDFSEGIFNLKKLSFLNWDLQWESEKYKGYEIVIDSISNSQLKKSLKNVRIN